MIKAIIFDCFGVLTGDKWKEFVATLPDEQKQPARDLNKQLNTGTISEKEFLKRVSELTGKPKQQIRAVINAESEKNTELLKYMAGLKPKYKFSLLSNVSSRWIYDFLTKEEAKLFDDFVLSFEVKMTKHNPQVFDLAVERLGLNSGECVFIDDNPGYCQTAKGKGLKAILYENFVQMKHELESILADQNN